MNLNKTQSRLPVGEKHFTCNYFRQTSDKILVKDKTIGPVLKQSTKIYCSEKEFLLVCRN